MMEDLDLDELDQAVNKMMDKPRGKKTARRPDDAPLTVPSRTAPSATTPSAPSAPEPTQQEDAPATDSQSTTVTVNRPMPKVPVRRRMHPGAMDIIQPSTPQKVAPPSHSPSRMAPSLQPTNPVPAPEEPQPTPPTTAPNVAPPPQTDEEVSEDVLASLSLLDDPKTSQTITKPKSDIPEPQKEQKPKNDWPDPLDFNDFDTSHQATEPVTTDEPKETPPSMDSDALLNEEPAPAENTTPFVTTKVEKRPLGAYADKPAPEPQHHVAETPAQEKPALVPDEATTKGDMAETAMRSGQHLFKEGQEPEHDMDDLRNMAIPPQYHTAHAEPTDEVHSVFDTKEYHAAPQPMHTTRKGGPGLVIAVVVLIVLVVAAVVVGYLMMTGFDITRIF